MENNIKNNIKILKEQILELQSIFDKIVGNMWNEEIKKFHEIRYETTKTAKTIEEMIGVEKDGK